MAGAQGRDGAAQLEAMQSQLAFLEETVAALNDALAAQQRELLTLRRQLTLLKQRQDEMAGQTGPGPAAADERPPHY